MFNKKRHLIIKTKGMSKHTKREVKERIKIRNMYWKEYQSIIPEVKERMEQWKIEHGHVDENGNPIEVFGQCYQEWLFEKKIMREKFEVDWPTIQDINPTIIFN